jgi:4-amino-4-deoxy-L-arabinose transferase-like glycosyltransferase
MVAGAGLGLALLVGATVRWTLPAQVEDLRPRPDALEYEEATRNLLAGEGYCLVFDGGRYPPRYPPGFSLLLVPAVWSTGGAYGSGIWTVLAAALVGIAALWALALVTSGPAAAAAAALLLAVAPLHVRWSRAVMADVPATTLTTLLVLGALACLRRRASWTGWLALGALAGIGVLLRPTCLLVAAPLAAATLAQGGGARLALQRLGAFAGGVSVGILPATLYGLTRFGSPVASGYGYWVLADFFDWSYAMGHPIGGGGESNLVAYARLLVGQGSLYPWPIAALALAGCGIGLARPGPARWLTATTVGVVAALLGGYLPFFWQWDRFLLPALPLLLALAVMPLGRSAPRPVRLLGAVLAGLAIAGAVRAPGAWAPPDRPLDEVAALRAIAARVEPDAALVARSNALLVSRLFYAGTDRAWVPIGRCEHRQRIAQLRRQPYAPARDPRRWILDETNVADTVGRLLAVGRPVYFTSMLGQQDPGVAQLQAQLATRFRLDPVALNAPTDLVRVRAVSAVATRDEPAGHPPGEPARHGVALDATGGEALRHHPESVSP